MSELKEGKRPIPLPTEITLRAGAFLFKEGDLSREVYIVKEGELSVTQRHGSQTVELARLGERAVLGEMSLLDNQPRSATVRASLDSKLTVIAPATFQAILKLVPAWLMAVVKVVTRRLRDTNARINQHTVTDPLESICVFLVEKSNLYQKHYRHAPVFQWFPILDEALLLTRMKREDIQKAIQTLVQRKLCTLNSAQEIHIPDPIRLDILSQFLSAERRRVPFLPANLDAFFPSIFSYLDQSIGQWDRLENLQEELQSHIDNRIALPQIQKLQELEILQLSKQENGWMLAKERLKWVQKANREFDLIIGRTA